jgi:hypothetical protein
MPPAGAAIRGMNRGMKTFAALALALAAACGGSSANHNKSAPASHSHSHSRETCERVLKHGFALEYDLKTLALDDHEYQSRKIELDLKKQEEETLASPTFMADCRKLTAAQITCMTEAKDMYTYNACQDAAPADQAAL